MSGLIGLCCNELGRFSECSASIIGMNKPEGSGMSIIIGGSIAKAWNDIGHQFLDSDAEWLMLLNDDHVYPPDTIEKLLAHNVAMVTGFYLKRSFPFAPVLYDRTTVIDGQDWYETYYPPAEASGLVPIVGCGDGCVLIRRCVLEAIPFPIWEISKYRKDMQSTDLIFCEKVREAGFDIWADLDVRIGHMIVAPIFPDKVNGQWRTLMLQRGNVAVALPAATQPPLPKEKQDAVQIESSDASGVLGSTRAEDAQGSPAMGG